MSRVRVIDTEHNILLAVLRTEGVVEVRETHGTRVEIDGVSSAPKAQQPRSDYVERGSYQQGPFLHGLSQRLSLSSEVSWVAGEKVWYFGGGYWRAAPVHAEEDNYDSPLLGVRLINAGRTAKQLWLITMAMNSFD